MDVIKVLAAETVCNTTPQAYNNAKLVRVFNNTAAAIVITRKDAAGNTIGSFSIVANTAVAVAKDYTDTLQGASGSIPAVPVAFSN